MQEIAANLYIETGLSGVNIGLIRTTKGLIGIDLPGHPQDAQAWAYQIRQLDRAPLRYIILTDPHADRILAGQWFNAPMISHSWTAGQLNSYLKRPPPILLERFHGAAFAVSENTVPTPRISFDRCLTLYLGETEIALEYLPGPTPGNIIVRLPQSGALFSGDLVAGNRVNAALLGPETNLGQWQASLNSLIGSLNRTDKLVTGRGEIGNQATAIAFAGSLKAINRENGDL